MCQLCDEGYCARHMGSTRFWLDFFPQWTDWREEEQEAHERDISNPDFLKQYVEAS